jgi:hypothetical protein
MNFRGTYIMFGLLLLLFAGAIVSTQWSKNKTTGALLPSLKINGGKELDTVEMVKRGDKPEKLVFIRDEAKRWKLSEPYSGRIDTNAINQLITKLVDAKKVDNADINKNLAAFGLVDPQVTLTLKQGSQSWVINLGNITVGSAVKAIVNVTTNELPNVPVAVNRLTFEDILRTEPASGPQTTAQMVKSLNDFRVKDVLHDAPEADNFKSIRLAFAGKETVLANNGGWSFEKPAAFGSADLEGETGQPPTGVVATISGVRSLVTELKKLRVATDADYLDPAPETSVSGLDASAADCLVLDVTYKPYSSQDSSTLTESILIGKKADEKGESYYAKLVSDPTVFKLNRLAVEALRRVAERPDVVRDRNLLTLDQSKVDAIDIKIGTEPVIELRKTGNLKTWQLWDQPTNPGSGHAAVINELLNALTARRLVKDFPDPAKSDADKGFDKPQAELTFWQDALAEDKKPEPPKDEKKDDKKDEKKEEKKDAGPTKPTLKGEPKVKLVFGKKDKDLVYVRRIVGKDQIDLAVPEVVLTQALRPELDYVDPTLPSFVFDAATKLRFNRGATVIELEREKDKAVPTWKFTSPATLTGRLADPGKVAQVLNILSNLRADKMMTKKPSVNDLERWGLKPAKVEVGVWLVVDLEGKPRTYQFGADAPGGVFAKQGERDLVFVTNKLVVEQLANEELQDLTIFRLDPTKLTEIQLTGWADVIGEPKTVVLTKKDGKWVTKSGADYEVNQQLVENFLLNTATTRADKIVVHKTGPTPVHKLDTKAGALEVTFVTEGEKEPVTLTLGGADADGRSIYATSKQAAGDVFLVLKDRFASVRAKPTYFKKD